MSGEGGMSCWFGHNWRPWGDVKSQKQGNILIQERRCLTCNKAKRRQTGWIATELPDLSGDEVLP